LPEIRIDVSKLEEEEENYPDLLKNFLKDRMNVTVEVSKGQVILALEEGEESLARRKRVRQLLKKFIHKRNLKESFRAVSGGENSFIIGRRRKRESD